jgi:hypothetical protein
MRATHILQLYYNPSEDYNTEVQGYIKNSPEERCNIAIKRKTEDYFQRIQKMHYHAAKAVVKMCLTVVLAVVAIAALIDLVLR